jgi:hypothetical protein
MEYIVFTAAPQGVKCFVELPGFFLHFFVDLRPLV